MSILGSGPVHSARLERTLSRLLLIFTLVVGGTEARSAMVAVTVDKRATHHDGRVRLKGRVGSASSREESTADQGYARLRVCVSQALLPVHT